MSQQSTDKEDSLIALDALLNIGSSVRAGGGVGKSKNVGSQVVERNLKNPMGGAGFSAGHLSAISAMLSLNASLGRLPPPPAGSPAAYNHLIAARAAAAVIQQSSQNSYSSMVASHGFGNGLIPFTAGNQSPAHPESRDDERRTLLPSGGDGTRMLATSSKASLTGKHNPANKEHVFRQEEVEAALRSKAQRGRKRDNLSVSERLELTRTRNREHAKGTR